MYRTLRNKCQLFTHHPIAYVQACVMHNTKRHYDIIGCILPRRYAPIGIFFLIAGSMAEVDDWGEILTLLGLYMATVFSGLAIHGLIILPGLYLIFTRKNPYSYLANVSAALVTALGTSSR